MKGDKSYSKVVMMPVQVAPRKHCWEWSGTGAVCGHFETKGGFPICDLGFRLPKYSGVLAEREGGLLKPKKCANLKRWADLKEQD